MWTAPNDNDGGGTTNVYERKCHPQTILGI